MKSLLFKYGLRAPEEPYKLAMIGDFLKDLDDEHSLCGVAGMIKLGLVELKCVVANLAPADLRARGAKGTLKMLGLGNVPVGVGLPVFEGKTHPYETSLPYLADLDEVEPDGEALLVRTLEGCEDQSVILVLQSGLTDAASLLFNHKRLFISKIHHVAIMGGLEIENAGVAHNSYGLATPNNAKNNSFDMNAATWLYRALQLYCVPMIVTTREVAYAAQVPFSAYDQFEATGNPVGSCLRNRQMPSLQHLWEAACSPVGSDIRGTLPADRNRAWFVKLFCQGKDPQIPDGANIWPYVGSFNLYDPSSLYGAIRELREKFLTPTSFGWDGVGHQIIGISDQMNGVKDAKNFAQFMIDIEILGLQK